MSSLEWLAIAAVFLLATFALAVASHLLMIWHEQVALRREYYKLRSSVGNDPGFRIMEDIK